MSTTDRQFARPPSSAAAKAYGAREAGCKLVLYLLLTCLGVTMIVPFLWMLSTSLKESDDAVSAELKFLPRRQFHYLRRDGKRIRVRKLIEGDGQARLREIRDDGSMGELITADPKELQSDTKVYARWRNYADAWKVGHLGRAYVNNIIIAVLVTVGQVLTSALAAFAFARFTFPGRDKLFIAYLATMMTPAPVTLIPVFILMRYLPIAMNALFGTDFFTASFYFCGHYVGSPMGVDSYFSLIVPGLFSAYGTFLLRQFFMTIPRDLDDAAKIDGAGYLRVWWHVILPISKPALATLAVFIFMGAWRMFLWPLIMVDSPELMPLMVSLQAFRGQYGATWPLLMAGSLMVLAPLMLVYIFAQRFFVSGIRLGAVKG